ncbi:MAG: hypothetical protein AB1521_00540 [Bacteroidota bacterium]
MIKIIENIKELSAIENDCNRLADNLEMPLLRFEWLVNCARTLGPGENMFVVILVEEGIVKAIAPLVLAKDNSAERLGMLGASLHGEPCGFLYEDETYLHDLLEAIARMNKTIFFGGIRELSLEKIKIEQFSEQNKNPVMINSKNVPYLPVHGTWESFQQKISKSQRSSLKRLLRIAEEMGKVSIEITTPDVENVDKYLGEIFETEASSWKKEPGPR